MMQMAMGLTTAAALSLLSLPLPAVWLRPWQTQIEGVHLESNCSQDRWYQLQQRKRPASSTPIGKLKLHTWPRRRCFCAPASTVTHHQAAEKRGGCSG